MHQDPVVWQKVAWQQGNGCYLFEVQQGGLHATLTAPEGRSFTIPTVAWYALFDALAAARKTQLRSERSLQPRSNARWGATEAGDLVAAFKAGASVGALARAHSRSASAIEAQLARLGLWDRQLQQPIAAPPQALVAKVARDGGFADPRPWPPDDWDSAMPTLDGSRTVAGGAIPASRTTS